MGKKIDLKGEKFGRLTIIGESQIKGNRNQIKWDCVCSCGNKISSFGCNLKRGITTSCGCYKSEITAKRNFKHGLAYPYFHNVLTMMKRRCYNKTSVSYRNYGA